MKYLVIGLIIGIVFGLSLGFFLNVSAEEGLIPSWIKSTASFWVDGQIGDKEFIQALQYLIKEGILEIPSASDIDTQVEDVEKETTSGINCANLSPRANLSGCDLHGMDLHGMDFTRANLSRANLSDANLSGAIFYNANLRGTNFNNADLTGAYLNGADLSRANLNGAHYTGEEFAGAKGCRIKYCNPSNSF